MKKFLYLLILFVGSFLISLPTLAQVHHKSQQHEAEHKMINQKDLQWTDGLSSLPKGAKAVVIEGDPTKEGPFTLRIQVPANYKIGPHWHPAIEHVTVLQGSLYMGAGEKYDESKATKLTEGGFAIMPVEYVHYAFTKEAATIQLHGMGPWGITYINAADDPRNKK